MKVDIIPVMTRWFAWPLLVSLMLQTLVAGGVPFGGSIVLCLSGEDHASHDAASSRSAESTACASGCGHHADLPTPSLQPQHEHFCSCLDITLRSIDLRTRDRDRDTLPIAAAPALVVALMTPADIVPPPLRLARPRDVRPPPPDPDLARLRTIRLLT